MRLLCVRRAVDMEHFAIRPIIAQWLNIHVLGWRKSGIARRDTQSNCRLADCEQPFPCDRLPLFTLTYSSIMRKMTLLILLFRHSAMRNTAGTETASNSTRTIGGSFLPKTKEKTQRFLTRTHGRRVQVGTYSDAAHHQHDTHSEHSLKKITKKDLTREPSGILTVPVALLPRTVTRRTSAGWRFPLRSASWRQPNMSPTDMTDHSTPHPA